jgi:GNAT superfamily N-acetyltransferase
MFLRGTSAEFAANCRNGGAGNRRRLQRIVQRGAEPGLLAYRGDHAVGWVSVGPRDHYPRVLRSPVHRPVDDVTGVWSIACFFIAPDARGQGVANVLLDAAIRFAQSHGARCIEAYPLDAGETRRPTATLWRGLLSQFEKAGFEVIARRKPARPIVRRSLC